jgi:hypothetical protein
LRFEYLRSFKYASNRSDTPGITLELGLYTSLPEEQEQVLLPENGLFGVPIKNPSFWISSF